MPSAASNASSTPIGTGRRGAILCFQVLRETICGVDLKGTWCQAGEEDRDEATLLR